MSTNFICLSCGLKSGDALEGYTHQCTKALEHDGLGCFRGLASAIYIYGATMLVGGLGWAIFKAVAQ